jgi:hypothetical protein
VAQSQVSVFLTVWTSVDHICFVSPIAEADSDEKMGVFEELKFFAFSLSTDNFAISARVIR